VDVKDMRIRSFLPSVTEILFSLGLGDSVVVVFFECYGHPRDLHSFPTRRSSDLTRPRRRAGPDHRRHGGHSFRRWRPGLRTGRRSEEHTSELQSRGHLVCRLLLEKKNFWRSVTLSLLISFTTCISSGKCSSMSRP